MEVAKVKITGAVAEASDLQTLTTGMVGATVSIEYDSVWDGLNKQVVFKTAFKTVNAEENTIPPELLRVSGVTVYVGVYGYTDDGTLVIPTVYAELGKVRAGADPEGDEAAKPTLPVWAQMQARLDEQETGITGINSRLDGIDTRLGGLETDLDNLAAAVGANLDELDALIGGA